MVELIPIELEIERFYIKDTLRALLHSILFHRTFDSIRPIEGIIESLDVTYCKMKDAPSIDDSIDLKLVEIVQIIDSNPNAKQFQLVLCMYEKKAKKSWFSKEDDMCWEEWVLTFTVTRAQSERDQIKSKAKLADSLTKTLIKISSEAGRRRDHIPAIVNSEPFPHSILLQAQGSSSWTRMITNLVS